MLEESTKIVTLLGLGNFLTVSIIAALAILVHFGRFYNFVEHARNIRLSHLEKAINTEIITGKTKTHLVREYEKAYYKRLVGVGLEREPREQLLDLFESAKGSIRFDHFRRSVHYMNFDREQITVNKPWLARFGLWVGITAFLLMVIMAVPGIALYFKNFEKMTALHHIGLAFIVFEFIVVAIMTFKDALTIASTKHIIKLLDNQKTTDATDTPRETSQKEINTIVAEYAQASN